MNQVVSLGQWMRARRRALDLTQEMLARRVGCAVITIRKLEADERRPSREMADRLAGELELTADEQIAFLKAARQELQVERLSGVPRPQSFAASSVPPAPMTSLIGRARELDAVKRRLVSSNARLVTLTGTGGTGKTRLAVEVAREVLNAFPDGVYFVALAPVTTPSLVLVAIAQALGIVEIAGQVLPERLKGQLREKRVLLVLDNFEHVLEAAPVVTDLLSSCPHLKVLVTSRAVLRLSGEHNFPVPPLPVPPAGDVETWETVTQNEAVRLFTERAQAVHPSFQLSRATAPVAAEICRRLDGLPLAIELAAARSTALSLRDILTRLESRLELLGGGPRDVPARQRTMRATIDWSYDALGREERTLFRRLAVFAGGWTLEAVQEVCAIDGEMDALEMLSSLVDKSLVRWDRASVDEGRFHMLATLRAYAAERLEEAGETELLRRRHAAYYLSVAERTEPELRGPRQLGELERLESEHDNLRQALLWSLAVPDLELSYRLAGSLWPFWFLRGHFYEWERCWKQLEPTFPTGHPESLLGRRAKVLLGRAFLAHYQVDPTQAIVLGQACLELYRGTADAWGSAASLVITGAAAAGYGGDPTVASWLETGIAQSRDVDDPWLLAWALQCLGDVAARTQGNYTRAATVLEESLELARRTGDRWLTAQALVGMAQISRLQYDYRRAIALAEESLALYRSLGDQLGIAWSFHEMGAAAYFQQDYDSARNFETERLAIERALGNPQGIWHALWALERVTLELGDIDGALILNEESLARARALGEPWRVILSLRDQTVSVLLRYGPEQAIVTAREAVALAQGVGYGWVRASALCALAWAQHSHGDANQSAVLFRDSLEIEVDDGNKRGIAECLEGLAAVSDAYGNAERAARLLAAAARLREAIHTPRRPSERLLWDPNLEAITSAPGADVPVAMGDRDDDKQVDAAIAEALIKGGEEG